MFPAYNPTPTLVDRSIRPDRRPAPTANEIRLRVKRATSRQEA